MLKFIIFKGEVAQSLAHHNSTHRRSRTRATIDTISTTRDQIHRLVTTQENRERSIGGQKDWWARKEWLSRWEETRRKRTLLQPNQEQPAVWNRDSETDRGTHLHKGWSRPISTMATLLRTEHIGLREYLTKRRVPDMTPNCQCGYQSQSAKHIVLFCPNKATNRARMIHEAGSNHWKEITTTRRGLLAAARWMINEASLDQFLLAKEEERERESERERRTEELLLSR